MSTPPSSFHTGASAAFNPSPLTRAFLAKRAREDGDDDEHPNKLFSASTGAPHPSPLFLAPSYPRPTVVPPQPSLPSGGLPPPGFRPILPAISPTTKPTSIANNPFLGFPILPNTNNGGSGVNSPTPPPLESNPSSPASIPSPPASIPSPPASIPSPPAVDPRYPPIYHKDPSTLTTAQRKRMTEAEAKSANAREAWDGLANVEREPDIRGVNEPYGDEDATLINSAKVRYNLLSDYPWGISVNYTGTRARTRGAFPERNISWMKARLGLGKCQWKMQTYEWVPSDQYQIVGAAFSKELFKLLGKHHCEGKTQNRPGWEAALRELAKTSRLLSKPVKDILLRYTSSSIGYTGPVIPLGDELWDQARRWMWHALDLVCQKIVDNDRKSMADAVKKAVALRREVGNEWFNDPDNHEYPTEARVEGAVDPLTGEPFT